MENKEEVEVLDFKEDFNEPEEIKKEKKPKKEKKKMKLWQKILIVLISIGLIAGSSLALLLYGPYKGFKEWLITTAMTTMSHQYLATWFYDEKTIEEVLNKNYVVESGEATNTELINFVNYDNTHTIYKNKYEKEILTKDEGNDTYKLININESGLRGYLVAIYDPSKVKIGTATNMQVKGEMLTKIAANNNAVVAMNASGFVDPGYVGNGSKPIGAVIKDGKLLNDGSGTTNAGGIIGFTNDNKLVLSKISASEAVKQGVRDAVEFGPFLIVNGKPSFIRGNGGWGTAPRSAIAQRSDGIVLFLVMDGRDYAHGIDGADMVDLTEILVRYGAVNAANLDGGTSCGLVINGELVNKPINGSGGHSTRAIPNGWIVTK